MIRLLLIASILSHIAALAQTPPSVDPTGWESVFIENFDNEEIVTGEKPSWTTQYPWGWEYHAGFDRWAYFPKREKVPCDNTSVNHVFENGTVKLFVREEPGKYEHWTWVDGELKTECNPYQYTGSILFSTEKYLYGYFEISCKVPFQGKHVFPAFWLWDGGGKEYREIDVFEFSNPKANQFQTNIHIAEGLDCGDRGDNKRSKTNPNLEETNDYHERQTLPFDVSADFHKYAVEWHPEYVAFYADDVLMRRIENHSPALPMHVIVNNAVAPWHSKSYDPSMFPNAMEVDYVKIWQRDSYPEPTDLFEGLETRSPIQKESKRKSIIALDRDGDGKDEILAFELRASEEKGRMESVPIGNVKGKSWVTYLDANKQWFNSNKAAFAPNDNNKDQILTWDKRWLGRGFDLALWSASGDEWSATTWSGIGKKEKVKSDLHISKNLKGNKDKLLLFSTRKKDAIAHLFELENGEWIQHSSKLEGAKNCLNYAVAQGDFNGDGNKDFVILAEKGELESKSLLYMGDSNGNFKKASRDHIHSKNILALSPLVIDQNGDGNDDIVFVGVDDNSGETIAVTKLSQGDGSWLSQVFVLPKKQDLAKYKPLIGDVNGDGKGDLIFRAQNAHQCGLNLIVLQSNGKGNWDYLFDVEPDRIALENTTMIAGDFNGDKRTDLLFVQGADGYLKPWLAKK